MTGTCARPFRLVPCTLNEKECAMKSILYVAFAVVVTFFAGMPESWSQPSGHQMVSPNDLKWADVPSLPPGAKIAVIEGPISEAVPFTFRLRFPANYQIPAHWHPAVVPLSRKHDDLAAKDQPFCMDQRRGSGAAQWNRAMGRHVRQPRG